MVNPSLLQRIGLSCNVYILKTDFLIWEFTYSEIYLPMAYGTLTFLLLNDKVKKFPQSGEWQYFL